MTVTAPFVPLTLADAGAVLTDLRARDGTERLIAHLPPDTSPESIFDAVQERHPSVELTACREREITAPIFLLCEFRQLLAERLTDRQWETLQTAYRRGFFERPRESTGEEVAETLDISGPTFSQHLRAGQRKLLGALFEEGRPFAE